MLYSVSMDRPSRLLLVLHRSGFAGTERHVLWLAVGMKERGWDVHLAVSHQGPLLRHFRTGGVTIHVLPRYPGLGVLYGARLAGLARRLRPDVLHAHSGRLAVGAGRLAGVPAVLDTRHGLGPSEEPPSPAWLRQEARRCRLTHRTITVCRCDRDRLISGGLDERHVVYIPNGIPDRSVEVRPPSPGAIRLAFLGRLEAEKGPLLLPRIGAALERRLPEGWNLAIAGEGPLRLPLARAFEQNGLASRISWLGETEGPARLLALADFLCVPSMREGQPLGVLEAMQAGVVPVARHIASLEELLAGDPAAGLLLPPDPEVWAGEIATLGRSPERLALMIEEGRRRVDRDHRLEATLDRTEQTYRDCFASSVGR